MNRNELLKLEALSHLSARELGERDPRLAKHVDARLTKRAAAKLARRFEGAEEPARRVVANLRIRPEDLRADRPVHAVLRRHARRVLGERVNRDDGETATEVEDVELDDLFGEASEDGPTLDSVAGMDLPIALHPEFKPQIEAARMFRFADAFSFDDAAVAPLVEADVRLGQLDADRLEGFVAGQLLDEKTATRLADAASTYRVLDENAQLVAAAKRHLQADHLSANKLVELDAGGFQEIIRGAQLEPPLGMDVEGWANGLYRKTLNLFPSAGLAVTLQRAEADLEFAEFLQTNKGTELLALDLSSPKVVEGLEFGSADGDARAKLVDTAKTYQRVWAVTDDVVDTQVMVDAGYTSAVRMASTGLERVVADTELEYDIAQRYWEKSRKIATTVTGYTGTIIDLLNGGLQDTAVGNVSTEVDSYLAEIPGFSDLFGALAYCDCKDCHSILGPAAYFVDLMCFIDEEITQEYFTGALADHVLTLKSRRPDLWTLQLTCENTHELVPYLEIINEILENAVATDRGFAGDFADRPAVFDEVYAAGLSNARDSFEQPFHLPVEQLKIYLSHFERTLGDCAEAVGAPSARAALGVSKEVFDIITTPEDDLAALERWYGLDFTLAGGEIEAFDAQDLVSATGLTRNELGRIVGTWYVTEAGTVDITIRGEKKSDESVQNDIERVHHLRASSLDRLHRFNRLWRALGWKIEEVDVVLEHLSQAGIASDISAEACEAICALFELSGTLEVSVDQAISLVSEMPTRPAAEDGTSLFDRTFNHDYFVRTVGELPEATIEYLHPSLRVDTAEEADANTGRLVAGLRVDEDRLGALVRGLEGPLGISTDDADVDGRKFALDADNLGLLYRHALLTRALDVTADELFRLCTLAPDVPQGWVTGLEDVLSLVSFWTWWKAADWSIDEIETIVGSAGADEAAVDPEELAPEVVEQVDSQGALEFARTVFAFVDGVSEAQSRAIIDANGTLFEEVGEDVLRLTDSFDPSAALAVPADVEATGDELRDVLLPYWSGAVLVAALPEHLDVGEDVLDAIVGLLGKDLAETAYMRVLRGDDDTSALSALLEKIVPLALLWEDDVFDAESIAFMGEHTRLFDAADWGAPEVSAVTRVQAFADHLDAVAEESRAGLLDALSNYDASVGFDDAGKELLAERFDADFDLVVSVHDNIALGGDIFAALDRMEDALALCTRFGVSGSALASMSAQSYEELAGAAAALVGAMHTKYDEDQWEENVQPLEDELLAKKRDGLVDYLVRSGAPQFDEVTDLYHYYLLDVELGGCARTSRLVAAISSLQLYVQRCRLNLERSPAGAADPAAVSPKSVTDDEWAWRKNYRVWEANRKVFLYPENYAEPELRDNKSPLCEELEEELLAQEINADTVRDAYARYLKGFEEVSSLKIAGAWHEKGEENDVLHLFGATAAGPPVFYYRRVENIEASVSDDASTVHWSPWRKIDVKIPSRKVSPVVYRGRLHVFWVEYVTKPKTELDEGDSNFTGYQHTMSLKYTVRKLDGSWASPQSVALKAAPFSEHEPGVVDDDLVRVGFVPGAFVPVPLYDDEAHSTSRDGYTLGGPAWERVYPWINGDDLMLRGADFQMISALDTYELDIDARAFDDDEVGVPWLNPLAVLIAMLFGADLGFPASRILWSEKVGGARRLHIGDPQIPCFENNAFAALVIEKERYEPYKLDGRFSAGPQWEATVTDYLDEVCSGAEIARFEGEVELTPVMGSPADAIIDCGGELFLLQEGARDDGKYHLRRLGTSVAEDIAETLFTEGVDAMLDIADQLELGEHELPFDLIGDEIFDATGTGQLDYTGPMGVYLREIFFHIPYLVANHLNSQGEFEEAQEWYHYVFNPTAAEETPAPEALDDDERERLERNRVWRYREFREIGLDSLRQQLTDAAAIAQYERDPFNPHAIARLRLSAYQKTILMKYVDNLLDWGDSLFSRFTMESINEATLLYVTAQELLGERPPILGDCGELEDPARRTFEEIEPNLTGDFLAEIETWTVHKYRTRRLASDHRFATLDLGVTRRTAEKSYMRFAKEAQPALATMDAMALARSVSTGDDRALGELVAERGVSAARVSRGDWVDSLHVKESAERPAISRDVVFRPRGKYDTTPTKKVPPFGYSLLRQINPVFCVPKNSKLLGYWDLVEDRLYKLRNCMTIDGVKKLPALFAPPIDPGLLVSARAAGLSLQQALEATGGSLPPYRFRYLVEKARQYVAGVQGFGASLLAALEKRDAEKLAHIRNRHQKNVLELTEDIKAQEVDAAWQNIETLDRRIGAATYRKNHYDSLISIGLLAGEGLKSTLQLTSSVLHTIEGVYNTVGAIAHLVPNVGSPFAMTYGGEQVGPAGASTADIFGSMASVASASGSAVGSITDFTRRLQGWEHQKTLAEKELDTLASQRESATIRKDIAEDSLELHRTTQEQLDEVFDYYEDKFSNLGLYTWLSQRLQGLYREAFNTALGFVRLAEQAYRFERDDDTVFLDGSAWDASRAGLLAGEQLMVTLNKMEKRFIETNHRSLEINQSFSVAQVDPKALLALKEEATCEFTLPEFFFDLHYPGHYKRRIKAVRLTIPCITGPYTNVSARLELVSSQIRTDASLDAAALVEVPPTRTTSVATSTAQGDAGVFELNFRDERYMPFEGAGAVSTWRLELPRHFRPFDYNTINDVILNVSYTAEEDGALREEVEGQNAAAESALLDFMGDNGLTRVLSLRQEYSSAFHRLMHTDAGAAVDLEISAKHFPLFLQGRDPKATNVRLAVVVADDTDVTDLALRLDGNDASGFATDATLGELPAAEVVLSPPTKASHTLELVAPGALARDTNPARLDPDRIQDVLLVIDYGL